MKTVLVTGVQGQDGSILADKYLAKGWKVVGIDLWKPTGIYPNIKEAIKHPNFTLETGECTDSEWLYHIFQTYKPDLVYHMAANSLVPESFKIPRRIMDVNNNSTLNLLEIIRYYFPKTKIYFAASSEMFGKVGTPFQSLDTPFIPNSPYAISKVTSFHFIRLYREAYGLFAVNGVLFNHEGIRRGPNFVTRKITRGVANINYYNQEYIELGNLDVYRDWGNAEDYVDAMILMMEANKPEDYIVATGKMHSVRQFIEEAFRQIGMTIIWEGKGLEEIGKDQNGNIRIKINPKYYRPAEVYQLCEDYTKTEEKLHWKPKTNFKELVSIMVNNDIFIVSKETPEKIPRWL